MENTAEDWHPLDNTPKEDVMVEIIDERGNTAVAYPTYYPFEVVKKDGDDKKPWGLRGTVVYYPDGKRRWDGGWMIKSDLTVNKIANIIGWRDLPNLSNQETRNCLVCGYFCNNEFHSNSWYDTQKK